MTHKASLFIAVLMSAVLVGPSAMAGKKKPTPKQAQAKAVTDAVSSGNTAPEPPPTPAPPSRPPEENINFTWINNNIINSKNSLACASCHGAGDENIDPTSYQTILDSSIKDENGNIPEDPNDSEFYNSIAPEASMPAKDQSGDQAVQLKESYYGAVYWWIKAGAPND